MRSSVLLCYIKHYLRAVFSLLRLSLVKEITQGASVWTAPSRREEVLKLLTRVFKHDSFRGQQEVCAGRLSFGC